MSDPGVHKLLEEIRDALRSLHEDNLHAAVAREERLKEQKQVLEDQRLMIAKGQERFPDLKDQMQQRQQELRARQDAAVQYQKDLIALLRRQAAMQRTLLLVLGVAVAAWMAVRILHPT